MKKKKFRKLTGKLAFLNAIEGTSEHELMMKMNNCVSGRCDLCHWTVVWKCYNKLRNHILEESQKRIYEYLKTNIKN